VIIDRRGRDACRAWVNTRDLPALEVADECVVDAMIREKANRHAAVVDAEILRVIRRVGIMAPNPILLAEGGGISATIRIVANDHSAVVEPRDRRDRCVRRSLQREVLRPVRRPRDVSQCWLTVAGIHGELTGVVDTEELAKGWMVWDFDRRSRTGR